MKSPLPILLSASFALTGCPQQQTPEHSVSQLAQEWQAQLDAGEAELRTETLRTDNLGRLEHWDGSRWWQVVDLNSFPGVGTFKMDGGRGWLWTGTEWIRCRYAYVGPELYDNERRLVSPNGSANGPWINADKYVSEKMVTNLILMQMMRHTEKFEEDMRILDKEQQDENQRQNELQLKRQQENQRQNELQLKRQQENQRQNERRRP